MLLVGLTGGIGSGKSTVAARLADHGAELIDADAVAREVVEPGEPALAEIRERFGPGVITADGALDRSALADIVFDDADARADLEAITHPRIGAAISERLAAVDDTGSRDGRRPVVVVDHPLLLETGQVDDFPVVVAVLAPPEVRLERLTTQRGMDADDVRARIASQATDDERRAAATHVIDNSGGREQLAEQVDALWRRLETTAG